MAKKGFLIRFDKDPKEVLENLSKLELRSQHEIIIDAIYLYDAARVKKIYIDGYIKDKKEVNPYGRLSRR